MTDFIIIEEVLVRPTASPQMRIRSFGRRQIKPATGPDDGIAIDAIEHGFIGGPNLNVKHDAPL